MKKFAAEFKTFITRGNVMDLAVGVIIGGAFQSIISSLVNDLIMPVISLFTGGMDFTGLFLQLGNSTILYDSVEAARSAGVAVFAYGSFLTTLLNFLIMALVIFCMVKFFNKLTEKLSPKKEAPAPTAKVCPYCRSKVDIQATRCPHCTSQLS